MVNGIVAIPLGGELLIRRRAEHTGNDGISWRTPELRKPELILEINYFQHRKAEMPFRHLAVASGFANVLK
jgi:hypothetical protein